MKRARPSVPSGPRRRSPAAPARLAGRGLRRPTGPHPSHQRTERPQRWELSKVGTLLAAVVTLALAVPSTLSAIATLQATRSEQQQQITDRFSKAVEHLGTTNNQEMRLGGIYALERLARDSPRDHPMVMEILNTFIHKNTDVQRPSLKTKTCSEYPPAPDVQAALTVLGRRDSDRDSGRDSDRINLARSCLQKADLRDANLAGADLPNANLPNADLRGANLANATLRGADLTDADLTGATLRGADLTGAHLAGVDPEMLLQARALPSS